MYLVVHGPVHKLFGKEFRTLSFKLAVDWLIYSGCMPCYDVSDWKKRMANLNDFCIFLQIYPGNSDKRFTVCWLRSTWTLTPRPCSIRAMSLWFPWRNGPVSVNTKAGDHSCAKPHPSTRPCWRPFVLLWISRTRFLAKGTHNERHVAEVFSSLEVFLPFQGRPSSDKEYDSTVLPVVHSEDVHFGRLGGWRQ